LNAPARKNRYLPWLVLVSLLAILLPWWLQPGEEGLGGGNIPPDPFADRVDARAGWEALPAESPTPDLGELLEQLAPQTRPPAQPPLPTVRLWLVALGPFPDPEAAEAARQALVAGGLEAAVEADDAGRPWWVITGPATDPEAAADLLARARRLAGAEGRVEPLE